MNNFELAEEFNNRILIRVVGIGNGGSNAVDYMYDSGIDGVKAVPFGFYSPISIFVQKVVNIYKHPPKLTMPNAPRLANRLFSHFRPAYVQSPKPLPLW